MPNLEESVVIASGRGAILSSKSSFLFGSDVAIGASSDFAILLEAEAVCAVLVLLRAAVRALVRRGESILFDFLFVIPRL